VPPLPPQQESAARRGSYAPARRGAYAHRVTRTQDPGRHAHDARLNIQTRYLDTQPCSSLEERARKSATFAKALNKHLYAISQA
jgi:hypothetical protein